MTQIALFFISCVNPVSYSCSILMQNMGKQVEQSSPSLVLVTDMCG